MTDQGGSADRDTYYGEAASWSYDRSRAERRMQRLAWTAAAVAATIALFEAIAIVALTPLKTVVPYTLLVDRETGYIEALRPLDREMISPDHALTRSFLAQYVIAREGFDVDTLNSDYRKVALWSAGEARDRYIVGMQAANPLSPLATLPHRALIDVQVKSISSLNSQIALVRFTTKRTDPGAQAGLPQSWVAVINWRFSRGDMSADDRLLNPLGFQVVRYRRDAETLTDLPAPQEQPLPRPIVVSPIAVVPSDANSHSPRITPAAERHP
jgi:type IV secretion system protein VirB8